MPHNLFTEKFNMVSVSPNDHKSIKRPDRVTTHSYGYYSRLRESFICPKIKN